jgi:hypothetical protein
MRSGFLLRLYRVCSTARRSRWPSSAFSSEAAIEIRDDRLELDRLEERSTARFHTLGNRELNYSQPKLARLPMIHMNVDTRCLLVLYESPMKTAVVSAYFSFLRVQEIF